MEKKREGCDVYGFHPGQDERVGFAPQGQDWAWIGGKVFLQWEERDNRVRLKPNLWTFPKLRT